MTKTTTRLLLILVLAGAALSACVERTRGLTAAEREQIRAYVSRTEPPPSHRLDISFEDKVVLVGFDASPATWRPGRRAKITWYWKTATRLDGDWRLFTHLSDNSSPMKQNLDGEGLIRRLYQPSRWNAGEYVKDEQELTLPADWNASEAVLYVGLFNGGTRMRVIRGASDGDNRARGASIRVERSAENAEGGPVPTVLARHLEAPAAITIDGRADEEAWRQAVATTPFVNTMTGAAAEPRATAKTAWDDENLYIALDVADPFLHSTFRNADDHLWEQDCVEVMIDPGGDARNYFEMQVSPTGVVFDTRYDAPRQPAAPGHVDWNSGLRAAVDRRGPPIDDVRNEGYLVEMAIPWTAFAVGDPPASRPTPGDQWRINFFVMDTTDAAGAQRSVGWSPPRVGDFHTLNRFGRLRLSAGTARAAPGQPPTLPLTGAALKAVERQTRAWSTEPPRATPHPGETVPTRENPRPE